MEIVLVRFVCVSMGGAGLAGCASGVLQQGDVVRRPACRPGAFRAVQSAHVAARRAAWGERRCRGPNPLSSAMTTQAVSGLSRAASAWGSTPGRFVVIRVRAPGYRSSLRSTARAGSSGVRWTMRAPMPQGGEEGHRVGGAVGQQEGRRSRPRRTPSGAKAAGQAIHAAAQLRITHAACRGSGSRAGRSG